MLIDFTLVFLKDRNANRKLAMMNLWKWEKVGRK